MALDKASLEFILFQREQLQISVLDPLQRIKGAIGRCLPAQKVQIIHSLLNRDVGGDFFAEVDDGEVLMEEFDLYYGKDNLNFIERLLNEANLQDLAQMLQNWKSRSRALAPNIFYQYGFFPLWIKARYNFIEFSERRENIFRTLKNVFGIPESEARKDPMVYMGVSLGKRDVLLCVLVPHSLRHHIKTSLHNNEMASQLKSARICGVYFSRVKKGHKHEFHKDGIKGSNLSISSISESMTNSDYGELHDAVYEDVANRYKTSPQEISSYHGDENSGRYGNDIVGKLLKPKLVRITEHDIGNSKLDENGNNHYHGEAEDYSSRYDNKGSSQQLVRTTEDNMGDSKLDENGNINEYYLKDYETHHYGYEGNRPQLVRISSVYIGEKPSRGSHGNINHGCSGNVSDHSGHNEPQLVQISSGYVRQDSSNKIAKLEEQKPSYGRCFFVDYNSNRARNSKSDNISGSHYQPQDGRPQFVEEEIMQSQQSDFVFDEPSSYFGNHRNELSDSVDEPKDGLRVSPAYLNDYGRDDQYTTSFWYSSSDAETLENERNKSYLRNDIKHGSKGDRTEFDIRNSNDQHSSPNRFVETKDQHFYHQSYRSYHSNENGENEPRSYHSYNNESYYRNENGYNASERYHHRDKQFYHGDEYDYDDYVNDHMHFINEHRLHHQNKSDNGNHEADYHGNVQNHHSNINGYINDDDNKYVEKRSYLDFEQNKDNYSYYGNETSYDEVEVDDIVIPQPEPKPRSLLKRNSADWQSTNSFSPDFEPVRRSTPTSSLSSFAKHEFSQKPQSLSRSLPALYSRENQRGSSGDWTEGNRSYRPKYESQFDLEDSVFVESHSDKYATSPPPYSSPPNYRDTMIKKSFLSLSEVCVDSRCKKTPRPLLSSQSVGSIYKEKELLLNRIELHESIRCAEEKQWEILLDKSKEFLVAAKLGDEEEVQILLDEGVDVDYKNEFNHTALMIASREGHLPVIHILISYNADLNTQDKYGKSPLHEAAWSGHHQIIHPLLSKGADVNVLDEDGRSPLHYAALRGKTKVAENLLLLGADSSILNKDGESAVELAYKCRHKDIVKLLLNSTDKVTKKEMQGKLRKLRIARIKSTSSLPNLSKSKPVKGYFKRQKSLN